MKESEFERRFLDFVYRTELAITPGALAYYADIPIAEATSHLEKLVTREIVKMDVAANGDLLYSFPNRQRIADGGDRPMQLLQVAAGGGLPVRPALVPGSETMPCPYCGEAILGIAKKCKHCGEILEPALRPGALQVNLGYPPPALYRPRLNSGVAALLSFWPGAGHIYCGEVGAGLGWMMATFIGYVAFFIPGIILHICCIFAASSTAKRLS